MSYFHHFSLTAEERKALAFFLLDSQMGNEELHIVVRGDSVDFNSEDDGEGITSVTFDGIGGTS